MQLLEKEVDMELGWPFPQGQGLCPACTRHPAPGPVLGSWHKGAERRAGAEAGWAGLGLASWGSVPASPLPSCSTFE